jgi:hypothetical protein
VLPLWSAWGQREARDGEGGEARGQRKSAPLPNSQQVAVAFLGQTIYAQANILAYRDGFLITALAALLPTWLLDRARR